MLVSKEAAYHEAGHAVSAYLSPFHGIADGKVNIGSFGSGAADIRLSKKKVQAAGKTLSPAVALDPKVAASMATVLAAGFAAEQIAASLDNTITPNPVCSGPDYVELTNHTQAAGISSDVSIYHAQATSLLQKEWAQVERLAEILYRRGSVDGVDIAIYLESIYGPRP
jgi:hypothetical protein